MIEPKRLLDGEASDFERSLLRSVLEESPSSEQSLRMMQGVCTSGSLLWTARAKNWAAKTSSSVVGKSVVGLALLGLAGAEAYSQRTQQDVTLTEVEQPQTVLAVTSAPTAPPERVQNPLPSSTPTTSAVSASTLGQEVRLLDRVRAALRSHSPQGAASALRRYQETFPQGILKKEALVLGEQVSALKPSPSL